MTIAQIKQPHAMELLSNSLSHRPDLETPAWHKTVLDGRRKRIASGKAKFLPLANVKKPLLQ